MKNSKRVTFKFDERSLTTLENMMAGDELQEITLTNPETGKQEKVFVPKLASLKICSRCGGTFLNGN